MNRPSTSRVKTPDNSPRNSPRISPRWTPPTYYTESYHQLDRTNAACDGPSYLRRSVLQARHQVQRVHFSSEVTQLVTVRRIYDGPCCSSVVKFRESILVPRFQSWSVLERRPLTNHRAYDGSSYMSSRVIRRATEEITQVWDNRVHHCPS